MKKTFLLWFGLLLVLAAYTQPAKEHQAVQQAIEYMFAAISTGDTLTLRSLVTPQMRFYEYGQVWTIDTLINKVKPSLSIPDYKRTNSFVFVHTAAHEHTGWATYYLTSIIRRNGEQETVRWMETVVLLKEKGTWKPELLHSTRLTPK